MTFGEYANKVLLHSTDNYAKGVYMKYYHHYNAVIIISERIKEDADKLEKVAKEIKRQMRNQRMMKKIEPEITEAEIIAEVAEEVK